MFGIRGRRLAQRLGEVWKFRHRTRGRPAGIEGAERRHRAGRETLITVGPD